MKSEQKSIAASQHGKPPRAASTAQSSGRFAGCDLFALAFGLFLGLALIKFGNPVILDARVTAPTSYSEFVAFAWPPRWCLWLLVPFAIAGGILVITGRTRWPATRWLWLLPLIWFGWQLVAATRTVDGTLTSLTLWQFGGCLVSFFLGALLFRSERALRWLLVGILAGFAFCLLRAANQRMFEFPRERQLLVEGQRSGWTNVAPDLLVEWRQSGVVVTTNGVEVVNPLFLKRYGQAPPANLNSVQLLGYRLFAPTPRVLGTLVYPNALCGVVLLLWPLALTIAVRNTRRFRTMTRFAVIVLTLFLGGAAAFWSGSKFGWLIAIGLAGVWLLRLEWPARWKITAVTAVVAVGLVVFLVRFHNYFAAGATSVTARFDYWRAAVRITREHPLTGSGPGTFQRPYELIKSPHAEMARLTHNDYLEQFSDSGLIGGISYLAWVGSLLAVLGNRVWRGDNWLWFAAFMGVMGWFVQGLTEFGLYIPALAWTAFSLAGCLLALTGNQIDKASVNE